MISSWALTSIRALIIALAVTLLAQMISSGINYLRGRIKVLSLVCILSPLVIPPLLPAYAYSAFSFNFQTRPFPNEILYFFILVSRLLPITVLIYTMLPPAYSRSSIHCDKLLNKDHIPFIKRAAHHIICFFTVFLFAFNEYEIASLMRIKHWTVTLFNAHAGGLVMNLAGSYKMALLPAFSSLTAITSILLVLKKNEFKGSRTSTKPGLSFLFVSSLSAIISIIIPLTIILLSGFNGFKDAFSGSWMRNEFLNSIIISFLSTACCITVIWGLSKSSKKLSLLLTIPGLFGALLLGLLFIFLFNLPGLNSLKQTIFPLGLSLMIYGFPIALLMTFLFQKQRSQKESQIDLLPNKAASEIKWHHLYFPALLMSMPIFCYIWFDLTLSSMLAPASFTTVFPRIYNLMHYSENEKLSATVLITAILPFLLYFMIFILSRLALKLYNGRTIK